MTALLRWLHLRPIYCADCGAFLRVGDARGLPRMDGRLIRERKDAAARVRSLEVALEFYRDEWVQLTGFVVASAALTSDKGARARAALSTREEGSE